MHLDATAVWARETIARCADVARRAVSAYYGKPRSAKRLHRARRDLARLSTALEDMGTLAKPDPAFVEEIHALRRRAGKVRDCDVLLRRVKAYRAAARGAERDQLSSVRRRLRARRKKARRKLRRLIRTGSSILKKAAPPPAAAPVATPIDAVRTVLRRHLADCTERQSAFESDDDEALHAFRLSCKRLHYVIERSSPDLPGLGPLAELLSKLTDALGIAHDCIALRESARACSAPLVAVRAQHDRDVHVRLARRLWHRGRALRDLAFAHGGAERRFALTP